MIETPRAASWESLARYFGRIDRRTRRVASQLDVLLYGCRPRLVNGSFFVLASLWWCPRVIANEEDNRSLPSEPPRGESVEPGGVSPRSARQRAPRAPRGRHGSSSPDD